MNIKREHLTRSFIVGLYPYLTDLIGSEIRSGWQGVFLYRKSSHPGHRDSILWVPPDERSQEVDATSTPGSVRPVESTRNPLVDRYLKVETTESYG